MVRPLVGGAFAAAAFVAVYAFFVLTRTGQRWENAVLAGRSSASGAELRTADVRLDQITTTTLVAAVILVLAIGLLRHRPLLAFGAAGVVCVSLVLAEVLKRVVLSRPDLVDAPAHISHNSFPSGHTTIAVSLMFALIMVMPYELRTWTALAVAAWGVAVSGYTVTAGWHRPSDTIGAALLVVVVACGATAVLALFDRTRSVAPGGFVETFLRHIAVAPVLVAAVVALGFGVGLGLYSQHELDDPGADRTVAEDNAYLAGKALAIGGSAAAVVLLLVVLRHIDIGTTVAPTPAELRERVSPRERESAST